jgi:hypothetical protein
MNVNEINLLPVNVYREYRQGVQSRFDLAAIAIYLPMTSEFARRHEMRALRGARY